MARVTIAELEQETADLAYFTFVGCDDEFDYFETPDGREYELPAAESNMRHRSLPRPLRPPMQPGGGLALFVKLRGGRWVPPDPEQMRDLFPGAGGAGW